MNCNIICTLLQIKIFNLFQSHTVWAYIIWLFYTKQAVYNSDRFADEVWHLQLHCDNHILESGEHQWSVIDHLHQWWWQ